MDRCLHRGICISHACVSVGVSWCACEVIALAPVLVGALCEPSVLVSVFMTVSSMSVEVANKATLETAGLFDSLANANHARLHYAGLLENIAKGIQSIADQMRADADDGRQCAGSRSAGSRSRSPRRTVTHLCRYANRSNMTGCNQKAVCVGYKRTGSPKSLHLCKVCYDWFLQEGNLYPEWTEWLEVR